MDSMELWPSSSSSSSSSSSLSSSSSSKAGSARPKLHSAMATKGWSPPLHRRASEVCRLAEAESPGR